MKVTKEKVSLMLDESRLWITAYEYEDGKKSLLATEEGEIENMPELPIWIAQYIHHEILGRVGFHGETREIAESIILKSPEAILYHSKHFIQNMWSKGQVALLDHIEKGDRLAVCCSLEYVKYFESKWGELEEVLISRLHSCKVKSCGDLDDLFNYYYYIKTFPEKYFWIEEEFLKVGTPFQLAILARFRKGGVWQEAEIKMTEDLPVWRKYMRETGR